MILFTASNFNLILCIILGIFSLSLFVMAFISGREIDMITLIPSSLILAVTAFAVGHSYYVEKQYEFCPNCHYQISVIIVINIYLIVQLTLVRIAEKQ